MKLPLTSNTAGFFYFKESEMNFMLYRGSAHKEIFQTALETRQNIGNTTYFNSSDKTVQLGNTITVTLTYSTYVKGFGVFKIPITLTAKHSGLSQKYWK